MSYIEIHLECPECEGQGFFESRRQTLNSEGKDYYILEMPCDECDGTGEKIIGDFYESIQEAKEDYPLAKNYIQIRQEVL